MISRDSCKLLANAQVRSYPHEVERSENLKKGSFFNPLLANGLSIYPLKISENLCFLDVVRGYRERLVT